MTCSSMEIEDADDLLKRRAKLLSEELTGSPSVCPTGRLSSEEVCRMALRIEERGSS